MSGCRYDHAAKAIRGLGKYLDSSAMDADTLGILRVVEKELKSLLQMEEGIKRGASKAVPVNGIHIGSAVEELAAKLKPLESTVSEMSTFLEDNRNALGRIKDMALNIKRMEDVVSLLTRIHKGIFQIVGLQKEL